VIGATNEQFTKDSGTGNRPEESYIGDPDGQLQGD